VLPSLCETRRHKSNSPGGRRPTGRQRAWHIRTVGGLAGPPLARPKLGFFSSKRKIDLFTSRGPTWPPRAARLLTTGRKQLRAISRHVAGPAGYLRSVTWIAVSTMRTATAAIGTAAAAIGTAAAAIGTATAAGRTATAPALYALIAA